MNRYGMALAGAVTTCVLFWLVGNARAADPNQPKTPPKVKHSVVSGTVSAVKDAGGSVTEVKVTTAKGVTYQVTPDEKGKELGKTMDGKKARVVGTLETKAGAKWLTVRRYSEQKAKSEPNQPPKSTEEPAKKQ